MSTWKQFATRFRSEFFGVWPYRVDVLSPEPVQATDEYGTGDIMDPPFRVSNLFREVTYRPISDDVHYRAIETDYGARAACTQETILRGEQGTVSRDNLYSFTLDFLSGRPLDEIGVERRANKRSYPSRAVVINESFSDMFWRSFPASKVPVRFVVRVTPNWLDLPLRDAANTSAYFDTAARDPAISVSGTRRAAGFQRSKGEIQYVLYADPAIVNGTANAGTAHGFRLIEAGLVTTLEIAIDVAVAWLNDVPAAELNISRRILRSQR